MTMSASDARVELVVIGQEVFRNGGTSTSTWPCGGTKTAKVAMARKLAIRSFWMMRQRMGLRADDKVRFARRTARTSRWCAIEHREIDWACSSQQEESEVNHDPMIQCWTEEMHGSTES